MAVPLNPADPTRLGDYEVLGRLGTGGQGTVYLATRGNTKVAIKLLHAKLLTDQNARARFVRELALLQRVAGFCTAQMLEADLAGDRPYIVSEYVPGPSLRELVQAKGPRSGADLDRLAIHSVTALTAIHRAGIVHRDFKPQNVLMGPDGPRVIDFGIAKALEPGATLTSQVVGTPAYMAPEQFTGTQVGPSADLHAWAVTLLYAATGTDPFAGGGLPAVFYRIMHETPPLDALPPQIAEVAAACLAKEPQARPSSEETLMWLLGQHNPPGRPPPARDDAHAFGEWPQASQQRAPNTPHPSTAAPDRAGTSKPYAEEAAHEQGPHDRGGAGRPGTADPYAPGEWPQGQGGAYEQGGRAPGGSRGEAGGPYAPGAGTSPRQPGSPYVEGDGPYGQGADPAWQDSPAPGGGEAYAPGNWPPGQDGAYEPGGAPMQGGPYGQGVPYPPGGAHDQGGGAPGGGRAGVADPYGQGADPAWQGSPAPGGGEAYAPGEWPQEQGGAYEPGGAPARGGQYGQGAPYAPGGAYEQGGPRAPGGGPAQGIPYGQGGPSADANAPHPAGAAHDQVGGRAGTAEPYAQGAVPGQGGAYGLGADSAWQGSPAPGGAYAPGGWPQGQGGTPVQAGAYGQGAARRGVGMRRTPALVAGLILAGLLAALDIAELAILVARPSLAVGVRGELLRPAITYTGLGMVTLVGVVLGLRGGRTATWVVLVVSVLRVLAWAGWSVVVAVDPQFMVYAGVSAVALLLLMRGLWSGRAT